MSFVTTLQEGPILTLTLNRPEALNALNRQVLEDLDAALDGVDMNAVRCLILTGAGEKAFAAGADIAAMADMSPEEAAAFSRRGNEVFRRIETFPLPTIAAVNGYALGRLRARHGLRYPAVQRERRLRPTGSDAGHHPGLRGHPAAHAPRRYRQG